LGRRLAFGYSNETQAGHTCKVPIQRPHFEVVLRGDRCDQEVSHAKTLAGRHRLHHECLDSFPGPRSGGELGQCREHPAEAGKIARASSGEDLDSNGGGERHLVGVEQRSQALGLGTLTSVEGNLPHRGVDEDHDRRRRPGRRRERSRSRSSLTVPSMALSSSIRFRRTRSCSETTTVSVFDLKPRRRRASSIRGSGRSKVVRIRIRLDRMPGDVKPACVDMLTSRRSPTECRRSDRTARTGCTRPPWCR